jgi:AcrR family transcriptional regulator
MSPRRSDAAERILREAMRLFAAQGYERTTVPEIQAAAGLTPGSGAMYKHFPSREAVLQAGVTRFLEESAAARAAMHGIDLPLEEALPLLAHRALDALAAERAEHRIAWRELEQFPALQARRSIQQTYRDVADWNTPERARCGHTTARPSRRRSSAGWRCSGSSRRCGENARCRSATIASSTHGLSLSPASCRHRRGRRRTPSGALAR